MKSTRAIMIKKVLLIVLLLLTTAVVYGQQAPAAAPSSPSSSAQTGVMRRSGVLYAPRDYGKPAGYFPNFAAPYLPRHVPAPTMTNTARVDQLLKDGKLMLSLDNAIALALENN